jgi:hypothetical protein
VKDRANSLYHRIYESHAPASCKVFLWLAVKVGVGQLTGLVGMECNIRWLVRLATSKMTLDHVRGVCALS